jgi:hypothetical protein
MTKTEIINAIAYADVPEGAALVKRDVAGISICRLGERPGDLRLVAAQILAELLALECEQLPEEPSSELFRLLHSAILELHQGEIEELVVRSLETTIRASHLKIIRKLWKIAGELKIAYNQPEDPLLR